MESNASFGLPPTTQELLARIASLEAALKAKDEPELPAQDLDSNSFPKKYVRVNIAPGNNATDITHVEPAINGFVMRIERGKSVVIPEVFAKVLNDAIEDITIKSLNGLITRPRHRFPFSAVPATEEEFLAQRAANTAAEVSRPVVV